ncbi:hypothetical protein BDV93DRAFT_190182 [Ceratobasidium sp. AG-I]|nr:hypothetical protein BDV93DRAFT_190182 [Ceratobasidium sp. AG-I]
MGRLCSSTWLTQPEHKKRGLAQPSHFSFTAILAYLSDKSHHRLRPKRSSGLQVLFAVAAWYYYPVKLYKTPGWSAM